MCYFRSCTEESECSFVHHSAILAVILLYFALAQCWVSHGSDLFFNSDFIVFSSYWTCNFHSETIGQASQLEKVQYKGNIIAAIHPVFILYFFISSGKMYSLFLSWLSSQTKLTRLHITCKGTIEDDGHGMLQVGCHRCWALSTTNFQAFVLFYSMRGCLLVIKCLLALSLHSVTAFHNIKAMFLKFLSKSKNCNYQVFIYACWQEWMFYYSLLRMIQSPTPSNHNAPFLLQLKQSRDLLRHVSMTLLWYTFIWIHLKTSSWELQNLLALFEKFSKFSCFNHQFFIVIIRFCTILGFMETQLLSH